MLGQRSGLNNPIRKLLSKIQKEFHYPKVFALSIRASALVRPLDKPVVAPVQQFKGPQAKAHSFELKWVIATCKADFEHMPVHSTEPIEEAAGKLKRVDCYARSIHALPVPVRLQDVVVNRTTVPRTNIRMQRILPLIARPKPKRGVLIRSRKPKSAVLQARDMPMWFLVTPFSALGKGAVLRYRVAALKILKKKPSAIGFQGVVLNLPPTGLAVQSISEEQGRTWIQATITSEPNPFLGRRSWVIVLFKENGDIMPVPVKEEPL